MNIDVAKVGLSGIVASWEVINPDGSIADACYNPKHNLILDVGLDMVGNYASIPACFAFTALGTGTSESTTGMTALETETTYGATTRPPSSGYSTYDSITIPAADANPFNVIYQIGIQTAVGKLNGTFTEIGFGPTSAKNANLWSRFRIKDSDGNPTSVTVNVDQQLRLKYQLSIRFLPIVPTAYTCAITGYNDTFGYTAGWQGITYNGTIYDGITHILKYFGTESLSVFRPYSAYNYFRVATVTVTFGTLTESRNPLTGTAGVPGDTGFTRDTYVTSSYANYINVTFSTLQAVGLIYGLQLHTTTYFSPKLTWLCSFDTPINKPDTHNLSFKLKFSWGRDS